MEYMLILNAKVWKDPIKHQEPIVDKTRANLENPINCLRKIPLKKGKLGRNSYDFKPILIRTTL